MDLRQNRLLLFEGAMFNSVLRTTTNCLLFCNCRSIVKKRFRFFCSKSKIGRFVFGILQGRNYFFVRLIKLAKTDSCNVLLVEVYSLCFAL